MLQNEFPTVPDRDEDSGDPASNTLIGVSTRTGQNLAQ